MHTKTSSNLSEIALDIQFNAAVLAVAHRLFPCGFLVGEIAPQSYEELIARLESGKPMLVYSGGSERTIYGCPEVNYAFRAWHDWCHWRGRHDFSFAGETAVCRMQGDHLLALYGECPRTLWWKRILHAEVIEQREYFDEHGAFPDDQRAFVECYLHSEAKAVR
jgi:hypothetical protein